MKRALYMLVVLLAAAALLSACGGGSSSSTSAAPTAAATTGGAGATGGGAGDAKAGETLFASATIGSNPGCKTCHSLDGSKLVGPSMKGYGAHAANAVQGQSAEEYTRTSITDPNAHVVDGFTAGVMPSFKTVLSETQLNDVVAYLLTLK